MPLRQYRACVVDSLGVGITCVLYHCTMCTRHPDLVSFAFMSSLYSTFYFEGVLHLLVAMIKPDLSLMTEQLRLQQCSRSVTKSILNTNRRACIYVIVVSWISFGARIYIVRTVHYIAVRRTPGAVAILV